MTTERLELLTLPEAARALRCGLSTLYRILHKRELRVTCVAGRRLVSTKELNRFLELNTKLKR